MTNKKTLTVATVELLSKLFAKIDRKILTVATVTSLSIYLFNIVLVWKLYELLGFFLSATILFFARIAWIYFVISYADWMDEKREKITRYLQNLKARK